MFTSTRPTVERLRSHQRRAGGCTRRPARHATQSSQRRRSDQEQDWRARGRCALLALGLAACGSSSISSPAQLEQLVHRVRRAAHRRRSPAPARRSPPPSTSSGRSSLSGLTVNYQAVGSGAGITALESKTVDFGASDPPLKPADEEAIAKNGSPAVQIPMFLGAITVSYNLPGVKTGLKLDGKTIADIYLGKIKTWNDPEIKALNPGVNAARARRSPSIHRSDSSGTTAGFTELPGRPSTPNSRARSAKARTCSGRRARAPRATPAWPARSSRRPARSATSSRPTRCSTTSPTPR